MVRPSPQQIRSGADFQKTYMWHVTFMRLPLLVPIDITRFNMQCLTHDVPKRSGQVSEIMIRGHTIPDPGVYKTSGTLTLTFVETVDAIVRNFIGDWETVMHQKTGTFNQLTADLRLVSLDNQDRENYEYRIQWCFLEDSNLDRMEGSSSDPMQPSMTLRYTDFQRFSLV